MPTPSPYAAGLDRHPANHAPLTPLTFLDWSAHVFPDRPAVVHGERGYSWAETAARCRRLGSALASLGVAPGQTVAAMLSNTPEMFEAHFGVAMAGAVLNTLNTRLDAAAIRFMLGHGEARVVLVDREFAPTIARALDGLERPPLVVNVADAEYDGPGDPIGDLGYEELLAGGDPAFPWSPPADEWDAVSLNYTSGTTGDPKGVVFSHRGAYLNAIGEVMTWQLPRHAVYLWTLPMFHCNGWCFPWALAAVAGTSICLRKVDPALIYPLVRQHGVTHYCGAPIVHDLLINAPASLREGIGHRIRAFVAGAAPPAATLEAAERVGIDITHVYGLTETYGPATSCVEHSGWADLPPADRARLKGRQGVRFLVQEQVAVLDPETMAPVPADGETVGEVMFRGNIVMKGYLKNPAATGRAFAGGWFHSGDLAVMQPDGYFKVKDRSKDIIISGGENISSLEVEDALHYHPAVLAAAVVAKPDPKWGETPCAFVELKEGAHATPEELIAHCRERLAHFKAPRAVVFGPLPRTSTGKIQKYVLRERVRSTDAIG